MCLCGGRMQTCIIRRCRSFSGCKLTIKKSIGKIKAWQSCVGNGNNRKGPGKQKGCFCEVNDGE